MDLLQQIKDFLIPELESIRQEQSSMRERLNAIDLHLVDQSRRIDAIHQRIDESNQRIDESNQRIDETNQRIDRLQADLIARIDAIHQRIDRVQADFIARFDKLQADSMTRFEETHRRLDRLYEVIVRRDEHDGLERWVRDWSREVDRRLDALERRAA